MSKSQHSFEKRRRELEKKKKQDEKRQRKLEKKKLERQEGTGAAPAEPAD